MDCILCTIDANLLIFLKLYFRRCSIVISLVRRFIHKILQKYKNTAKSVAQNVKSVAQNVKSVAQTVKSVAQNVKSVAQIAPSSFLYIHLFIICFQF